MPVVSSSVPASLPPSGTASGDLSGTYPGPTVAKVNGIAVTGTPSVGYVPTATSASAATWQVVSASPPHTQESLTNAPGQTIANNDFLALDWALPTGDALLSLTAPALPTIVTTGIYAFNTQVYCTAVTIGGYFQAQLELDVAGADWTTIVTSPLATAAASPIVAIPVTMYLTAGMQVKLTVQNFDGVASRAFTQATLVQRVG